MTNPADHEFSLRQMQAGVEALSEGFALFDDDDELVFCNSAFKQLYPDLQNFLRPGLPWPVFLVEVSRKPGAINLDPLDTHHTSGINTSLTIETSDHRNHWYRVGMRWVEDGGFVMTQVDITDQHQAHEIIEHADDLLRDILDACASRIVLYDLSDGSILYRTPAWDETFGQLQTIRPIFDDPVSYADMLADMLSTSRLDDLDNTLLHASGHTFPARISVRVIEYQGNPAAVMSVEDMTQIHQQREEIVLTNQRLLDAIEALDQGFVLFDANHRLLMANQHYLDVNQPVAGVLEAGASNTELVRLAGEQSHEPQAVGWPDATSESLSAQYEFELNDKRVFAASRQATSDGGFVVTWRDVTDQKATEQELVSRRETAFQNEKLSALGQLLAGVAHELNNPLSVVLGHAMMLKEEVTNADALDGIDKISRSAERCAKIVKTFLAMARQKPAQLEQCGLNDIIEMALEIASYGMRKSGIAINLQLADDLPSISVDEDQVTQVFINLMINAEQALKDREDEKGSPVLQISTLYDRTDDKVVARVSDNGPGIPDEQRLRIFEPFYTTKAVGEGTGVGLALSHRIISSHDGILSVTESELGGATFTVSLPACRTKEITLNDTLLTTKNGSIRALLVEDEPDVSSMMVKLLSSLKVDVTVANNAEEGLKTLQADNAFDLILCDLRMPGMGGLGMLREIESHWPELSQRFVFVTGDAISEDVKAIRQKAVHPVIEKPVSPSELKSLLQTIERTTTGDNLRENRL
ncbi:MAG: PAS-domain containing protein [Granulosicoccus sp.]|nr:PAS-domain containing protein [Granulosicoccus sp.]